MKNDKMQNKIAYELGKRAQEEGAKDCQPFEDETFTAYVEKHDPPIVLTIHDYVAGYHESDTIARARRAGMHIVEDN